MNKKLLSALLVVLFLTTGCIPLEKEEMVEVRIGEDITLVHDGKSYDFTWDAKEYYIPQDKDCSFESLKFVCEGYLLGDLDVTSARPGLYKVYFDYYAVRVLSKPKPK